jgi:hypothetical protein
MYVELSKKKNSIESKVDMKLPFAMLLMTPYMAQINFFPKFQKFNMCNFIALYANLYATFMMKDCFHN